MRSSHRPASETRLVGQVFVLPSATHLTGHGVELLLTDHVVDCLIVVWHQVTS